jgi:uncharacterized protein (DUF1330 family)
MSYQILVGLFVTDDQLYSKYRTAMKPILTSFGGKFGYDLRVAEMLKSETTDPINRVFTIIFVDRASKAQFFSDENYLAIKEKFFKPSVSHATLMADYDLDSTE